MYSTRRLFIGDIHGCLQELEALLEAFKFNAQHDQIFCAGDIVGKGPNVVGVLQKLKSFDAKVVRGNHDEAALTAAETPEKKRSQKQKDYLEQLKDSQRDWIAEIAYWPLYLEFPDLFLVHAGFEPEKIHPAEMQGRILQNIRTWDGVGINLNCKEDPAWFDCIKPDRTIVFGHWAKRGKIDLPQFKGLDTGCVYGGALTGWCPEENRFYSVKSFASYAAIHYKDL